MSKEKLVEVTSIALKNVFSPLLLWFIWASSMLIIIIAIKDVETGLKVFFDANKLFFVVYISYVIILIISFIIILRRKKIKDGN